MIMPRPYPILGICFAHQAISKVLGGEVGASGSLKVGPVRVDAVQKKALPHHFSESDFLSWNKFVAYHEDQVQRPPSEMLPIFASDYCAYQGFLHPTLPLWTVQFHPEMNENILELASEKDLWAPFGRDDLSDQKGNELLEFFAAWVLKNKK